MSPTERPAPGVEEIQRVKRAHEERWLALGPVVGVGIGLLEDGRTGIVVSLRSDSERVRSEVPARIEGVPVEIRVVGDIRAR